MALMLALAGDTMLGRQVARRLDSDPDAALVDDGVIEAIRQADLFFLNLECCVSARGRPWADPDKPFFFRAPPVAARRLAGLGVDAVTLANNHALDYGPQALLDSIDLLAAAGVAAVGAGRDAARARAPVTLEAGGLLVRVVAVTDHPADFAAGQDRPGVAYADLSLGAPPDWLSQQTAATGADVVVVMPHWGPNLVAAPVAHVRAVADALHDAGAAVVAGHSAHVFHGARRRPGAVTLYDLGDFLDDYATDELLRNDLGLLWFVEVHGDPTAPVGRVEALPLAIEHCRTRAADPGEAKLIKGLLAQRCAEFGTHVEDAPGGLLRLA